MRLTGRPQTRATAGILRRTAGYGEWERIGDRMYASSNISFQFNPTIGRVDRDGPPRPEGGALAGRYDVHRRRSADRLRHRRKRHRQRSPDDGSRPGLEITVIKTFREAPRRRFDVPPPPTGLMQAQGLVDVEHDRVRDDSQPVTDPLHGDRSDLLSLCLGVAIEPGRRAWKQNLERVNTIDVRCDGNHRDDADSGVPQSRWLRRC